MAAILSSKRWVNTPKREQNGGHFAADISIYI